MLFPRVFYIDLDEVFCDFVGGACALHGFDRERIEKVRRRMGVWSIVDVVQLEHPDLKFSNTKFWEPIKQQQAAFWLGLQPLPWASRLRSLLNDSGAEWYILTGPTNCHHCYAGKVQWIQRFFGSRFNNYIVTPHKNLLARPGAVLVDDNHHNLQAFVEAPDADGKLQPTGARGVLFSTSPLYEPQRHGEDVLTPIINLLDSVKVPV